MTLGWLLVVCAATASAQKLTKEQVDAAVNNPNAVLTAQFQQAAQAARAAAAEATTPAQRKTFLEAAAYYECELRFVGDELRSLGVCHPPTAAPGNALPAATTKHTAAPTPASSANNTANATANQLSNAIADAQYQIAGKQREKDGSIAEAAAIELDLAKRKALAEGNVAGAQFVDNVAAGVQALQALSGLFKRKKPSPAQAEPDAQVAAAARADAARKEQLDVALQRAAAPVLGQVDLTLQQLKQGAYAEAESTLLAAINMINSFNVQLLADPRVGELEQKINDVIMIVRRARATEQLVVTRHALAPAYEALALGRIAANHGDYAAAEQQFDRASDLVTAAKPELANSPAGQQLQRDIEAALAGNKQACETENRVAQSRGQNGSCRLTGSVAPETATAGEAPPSPRDCGVASVRWDCPKQFVPQRPNSTLELKGLPASPPPIPQWNDSVGWFEMRPRSAASAEFGMPYATMAARQLVFDVSLVDDFNNQHCDLYLAAPAIGSAAEVSMNEGHMHCTKNGRSFDLTLIPGSFPTHDLTIGAYYTQPIIAGKTSASTLWLTGKLNLQWVDCSTGRKYESSYVHSIFELPVHVTGAIPERGYVAPPTQSAIPQTSDACSEKQQGDVQPASPTAFYPLLKAHATWSISPAPQGSEGTHSGHFAGMCGPYVPPGACALYKGPVGVMDAKSFKLDLHEDDGRNACHLFFETARLSRTGTYKIVRADLECSSGAYELDISQQNLLSVSSFVDSEDIQVENQLPGSLDVVEGAFSLHFQRDGKRLSVTGTFSAPTTENP